VCRRNLLRAAKDLTVVLSHSRPGHRPLSTRAARWSATHPWRAIALWLTFVVACIAIGQAVGLHQMSDVDGTVGQSRHAARMIHHAHFDEPDEEDVLITARHGSLDHDTARRAAAAVAASMRNQPAVRRVATPVPSPDGSALLVAVTLHSRDDTVSVTPLLDATAAVQRNYPTLRVEEVGCASLNQAVNDQVGSDLASATTFSLPVTLVILLLAFGAILAAGVPILLALSAVGAAIGLAALVSQFIRDSGTTSSMILLMGMAVGVDYSLFYVKRVRAERHRGNDDLDAIEIAAETSGHSVVVSGFAVIIAMAGLFLARSAVFASLAAGSIMVVAVAVLGSLTVLPAVLVKLGPRIDQPRVPVLWRWSMPSSGRDGDRPPRFWPALLRPALRRPGRSLLISVLALGALALPALGLHLQSDTVASLPRSIPATHTFDRLTAAFPNETSSHEIAVQAPASEAGTARTRLHALATRLDSDPLFVAGSSSIRTSASGTVHVLKVSTPHDPESAAARRSLTQLREKLVPDELRGLRDASWAVGGDTARSVDVDHRLGTAIAPVIGFVILLTLLIMGWVFRSAVIAVTTAAVNLLSLGAAFGVLVLVFGHTWAQGLLGFHSTGRVVNWIPLFTFAVLFGLSMDYHVFVLSHIREAAASGLATRDAVRAGIVRSAGTVTSAAAVMVSVFSIFAGLHMVEMKELGVSLAVAVLVDALVVRIVVLPSLMSLLGRWNWWPGGEPSASRSSRLGQRHRPVDLRIAVEEPDLRHAGIG
jgi:RND superfamily putative drug exporter